MEVNFDPEKCKQFVEKEFTESALPSLVDYVKIENISKSFYTAEEWKTVGWDKLNEACNHIKKWIENSGVKGAKIEVFSNQEQNLTPLIYVEI